jgi:hypothetical protein
MQPRAQRKRHPPIARHQQLKAALPGESRNRHQQSRRQPPRHHPRTARQKLHGSARVRQPQGVAE